MAKGQYKCQIKEFIKKKKNAIRKNWVNYVFILKIFIKLKNMIKLLWKLVHKAIMRNSALSSVKRNSK